VQNALSVVLLMARRVRHNMTATGGTTTSWLGDTLQRCARHRMFGSDKVESAAEGYRKWLSPPKAAANSATACSRSQTYLAYLIHSLPFDKIKETWHENTTAQTTPASRPAVDSVAAQTVPSSRPAVNITTQATPLQQEQK